MVLNEDPEHSCNLFRYKAESKVRLRFTLSMDFFKTIIFERIGSTMRAVLNSWE